jgi:hypothetical protein
MSAAFASAANEQSWRTSASMQRVRCFLVFAPGFVHVESTDDVLTV